MLENIQARPIDRFLGSMSLSFSKESTSRSAVYPSLEGISFFKSPPMCEPVRA